MRCEKEMRVKEKRDVGRKVVRMGKSGENEKECGVCFFCLFVALSQSEIRAKLDCFCLCVCVCVCLFEDVRVVKCH